MKKILLTVLALNMVILAACKKNSNDDSAKNLALLALLNTNSGGLTSEQKSVSVSVNGTIGASSSAQSNGNMTASNEFQTEQMLIAETFENGMDPITVRNALSQMISLRENHEKESPVHLTAITGTSTGSSPNITWNFSGSVPGVAIAVQSSTVPASLAGIQNCPVEGVGGSSTPQGTATFTNGTLAYTGSGSSTTFNGSSKLTADVSFSNYGVVYQDLITLIQLVSNPEPTTPTTCAAFQKSFARAIKAQSKYAILSSGTASVIYNRIYSGQNSTSTVTSNSKYDATMNSNGLTVIEYDGAIPGESKTITMQNVKYGVDSSIQLTNPSNPTSITGSLGLSFSGIVNGVSIDQNYLYHF